MRTLLLLFACATRAPDAGGPVPTPPTDAGAPAAPSGPHGGHGEAHAAPHGDAHPTGHRPPQDDASRDAWQKPAELVAALGVRPGETVADVGAGGGYFNRWLAGAVGAEGRVVAVDVEPELVARMAERATREGTPQVEARLGLPDDPGLKPGEADLVLLVNTYHHLEDRVAWFDRLRAAVKPGGRLAVVDFVPGDLPVGPPAAHKIPPDQVDAELAQAGWAFAEAHDLLPYQFVRIYRVR